MGSNFLYHLFTACRFCWFNPSKITCNYCRYSLTEKNMKKRSPYHCSSLMLLLLIFMAVSVSESQVISMDQKAGTNSRTHLFKVENELGHLAAGLNEIHNVWMNHADDLSEFFSPKLHEFRYKNVLSDQQQNMENISMECLNAVVQFSLDLKDLRPYTKRGN